LDRQSTIKEIAMTRLMILTTAAATALAAPAAIAQSNGPSAGQPRLEDGDLVIEGVTAMTPGYLVVSEEVPEGAPASEPIGFTEVQPGENQELRIQGDFSHGGDFVVMLYEESGDEEGFQWQEGVQDLPVSDDGEHVFTTFNMMVEDGGSASDQ
jgi:hypothetical protein